MKTAKQMGRKSFTCLSTPFTRHPVSLYSANTLWEKLRWQLEHQKEKKTKQLKKQPSGNDVSTVVMLTKPCDLNQVCATGTLISHLSQNILKKLNHEYSESESPFGVTELLKAVCPCKGTSTLLQVISILPSLFTIASYTLYTGTE